MMKNLFLIILSAALFGLGSASAFGQQAKSGKQSIKSAKVEAKHHHTTVAHHGHYGPVIQQGVRGNHVLVKDVPVGRDVAGSTGRPVLGNDDIPPYVCPYCGQPRPMGEFYIPKGKE